ncbi:hypothetical protein AVEN_87977-1, partial [Araneus ventricosus]
TPNLSPDVLTSGDVYGAISNFLGSQKNLTRVELHYCYFNFQESVELLKEPVENSMESLKYVVIRGFIHYQPEAMEQDSAVAEILAALLVPRSLTSLEINYLIFELLPSKL